MFLLLELNLLEEFFLVSVPITEQKFCSSIGLFVDPKGLCLFVRQISHSILDSELFFAAVLEVALTLHGLFAKTSHLWLKRNKLFW